MEDKNPKNKITDFSQLESFANGLKLKSEIYFEKLTNPVFIIDLMGRLIFFNQASENLMGYSKKEVLGRHFRFLFTLDDLSEGFLFFYQTLKGCYSEHTLFRIRRKDGSTRVVDVMASPILFGEKVRAGLVIAQDITGRAPISDKDKERVEIFKKFNRDLEIWDQNTKCK